ncbi:MAG TPA: efflux RND transporter permease subunit [Bacteroidales bacterium]|nr:efflux RND transporter permease subunit [Bacteroidales bacterium]
MGKFVEIKLKFRHAILILVGIITLFLGYFIKDIEVNPDVIGYHPAGDKAAALFMEIGRQYGGNDLLIVGIEGDDVFTYEMLNVVRMVTDSVRSVPGISSVTSLTNVLHITSSEYGIEIGRLVDEFNIPSDTAELTRLRNYTLSEPMYRSTLVSEDATATLVVARLKDGTEQMVIVDQVKHKLSGIEFDGTFYFGGMPVILRELSSVIIGDLIFIGPVAFLLICIALFWGFRNIRGVVLPMLTVSIAIIWTMGLMSLLGYALTLLTNIIPVILLAVGSAYSIHVVNRIYREFRLEPKGAMKRAMAFIVVPVTLASLTTVFGFVSFIAGSYLTMIVEFGIFTSLGIIFSLILALTFVPALLSLAGNKIGKAPGQPEKSGQVEKLTRVLGYWVQHHPKKILAVWMVLVVAAIWGITKIERRVDLVDYFREENIVKKSEYLLREKFTGSMPLFIKISGDIQSPEGLRLMQTTQDFMAQFDYIPHSQSVADLIIQMNDAMGEGETIPDEREKIEQLWFLLDGQEIMEQLVNFELTEGLVVGHVASTDLEVLREIEVNFAEFAARNSGEDFQVEVTGIPIFFKRLDDSIINSQISSLVIASLLIIVVISIMMRSLVKGLLGIIPILVTLIVLFGTMGLTGVPLDIATVLCGSITIGIGIDYAIHFMTQFGISSRQKNTIESSIAETINISGRAILINMIAVSLGFAVLLFSNLVPMQRFGFLIALTMISTSMATLTLLPLLLSYSSGKFGKLFQIAKNKQKP